MDAGTVIADRFEIVEQAGRGGMASVHRAIDRRTSEPVAVKVLHLSMQDAGARFRREAEVLSRMHHDGIVGYVAHGATNDGRAFLAMRWIDGDTVAARVRRMGRLAPADVAELGANVAEALAAAHAEGIVHRDVKPANVLLASGGYDRPVLVDFGIARIGEAASAMTHEGMLIGTPGYISPEQARGSLRVDARADQFSLGCVLYACLVGHAPFRGADVVGVLAKILFQDTPRVRGERADVPAALESVLARAMAKEPADRFADAGEMARALRKVHAHLGGGSAPSLLGAATPATSTPGISGREARLLAMVIVGSATAGAGDSPEDATLIGGRFGGDVERLANGALAVRFVEAAGAIERALAAARCALALRHALPVTPISLATVRGAGDDEDVVQAIDRAAELVRDAPRSRRTATLPIRIDETTAGLLDARFDVRRTEGGLELVAESGPGDETRKLLGVAVPCFGRDRELSILDATLEEVESEGVARALIVTAEAGVGKSRLRREWLHRVRARGTETKTWLARADPLDSRVPHGLLGQALRRALALADDDPTAAKHGRLREHLARVLPDGAALARVLPFAAEILGAPLSSDSSDQLASARGDRALMANRLRRAFEEWIVAECKDPLLVVLDDVHWSDAATLRLLDAALGAAADHPLLVVVFARPALLETHPKLFAEHRVQQLRLEELSKRSAERLARAILGASAEQAVVDRVVALSNGNAFFLEELVRAVAERRGARPGDPAARGASPRDLGAVALPDSVLSVIESRLEALEPDARRVLRAASVFGQFFWPEGVAAVLGDTDEEAASAWIAALVRREIVSARAHSRFDDQPELTFRHAIVRDTAYSMLTPEDRAVAHRAAAAWLEARGEGEAAVLAAHFEAGGALEQAARCYARAAAAMLGGGEIGAACELVARGLACAPVDEIRAELLVIEADAQRWGGEVERSTHAAEEAISYATPGGATHMYALAGALWGYIKIGRDERRRELLAEAMRLLERAEPSNATCRLAASAGTAAVLGGEVEVAGDVDRIVERLVSIQQIDPAARGQLHGFRAFLADTLGDFEAHVRHFDAAAECFDQVGHERYALLHRANAGFARTLVGDYEAAARGLLAVVEDANARRIDFVAETAHCDLGFTFARMGRPDEARAHAEYAVEAFRRSGDQRMEGASHAYLARALLALGRTDDALAEIRSAVEVGQRAARQILPVVYAMLSAMELHVGDVAGALEHARVAQENLRQVRGGKVNEILVGVTLARALAAAGRVDDSDAVFAEVNDVLGAAMARIKDPRLRECFARVEENAAVLAWAARAR
jgi:tetratricopeptide (TPR) repeat protein